MDYDPEAVAGLVRQVVTRALNQQPQRPIVTEEDLRQAPPHSRFPVPAGALVTPLARQVAMERRIELVEAGPADALPSGAGPSAANSPTLTASGSDRRVALGADHGGYGLKEQLKETVAGAGYAAVDCGTHSTESVDYPDFAFAVARMVAEGQAWRGIIIDGAGIGSCMTANKVPGVRAAMCYDQATAVNSREHNNANVLTLGAGLIGLNLARQIVEVWLATDFGGGRHARRVDKIEAIGRRYAKR